MSSHHILARADALMHRRRQPSEAEDVPILTDIVETEPSPDTVTAAPVPPPAPPGSASATPSPSAQVVAEFRSKLRQQLIEHLQAHIDLVLPTLVDAALHELLPDPDDPRQP